MQLHAYYIKILLSLLLLKGMAVRAQSSDEDLAFELITDAMQQLTKKEEGMGMYFESIAYDLEDPKLIFSLPKGQAYKEGHYLIDGNKFEIKLGIMNAICDGQVMVITDEQLAQMYIDSFRTKIPGKEQLQAMGYEVPATPAPDMTTIFTENYGEVDIQYLGTETLQGKRCHKIKKYNVEKPEELHFIYWITYDTHELLLLASKEHQAYSTYWIKEITKAPEKYNYTIQLPQQELQTYYGYEVMDARFINNELTK